MLVFCLSSFLCIILTSQSVGEVLGGWLASEQVIDRRLGLVSQDIWQRDAGQLTNDLRGTLWSRWSMVLFGEKKKEKGTLQHRYCM